MQCSVFTLRMWVSFSSLRAACSACLICLLFPSEVSWPSRVCLHVREGHRDASLEPVPPDVWSVRCCVSIAESSRKLVRNAESGPAQPRSAELGDSRVHRRRNWPAQHLSAFLGVGPWGVQLQPTPGATGPPGFQLGCRQGLRLAAGQGLIVWWKCQRTCPLSRQPPPWQRLLRPPVLCSLRGTVCSGARAGRPCWVEWKGPWGTCVRF